MTPTPFTRFVSRNGIAHHLLGAVIIGVSMLLAACATPVEKESSANTAPRPIGVPENASPDEKGREILRVVIALVRHGDLVDTEFASRLLRLPIIPGKGLLGPIAPPFPQNLATTFMYHFPKVGPSRQSVRFDLDPREVCLRLDEFLTAFNKEFGIGTEIFKDQGPPPRRVLPEQGWREIKHIHFTRSRDIYQGMPNGLSVGGGFTPGGCASSIRVDRYRSLRP